VTAPTAARLAGGRLHLQHGPTDLVIEITGAPADVERAEVAAWTRFTTILDELVSELPVLRAPVTPSTQLRGSVARRMAAAAASFPGVFVTPMAGVAGAIAEEICGVIRAQGGIRRAYVNNGGDIALHLNPCEWLRVGLVETQDAGGPASSVDITAGSGVRGLATSGWSGRSFSLGIADAVTVLATSSALADVAATLVANAVDLPGHAAISREPADEIDPASDLGSRPVTVAVGPLTDSDAEHALDNGVEEAARVLAGNADVRGVVIALAGRHRMVGDVRIARAARPSNEPEVASAC
jgi:ApbE superfamily uncharacterized protein (UPF0280 family)